MANEADSGRTETLLIIDDEEMLIELLSRMVTRQGYKAIVATSAHQALKEYDEHSEEIDLVITDLVMPVMNGKKLAEELLKRDPSTKILVSTGFSAHADISDLLEEGVLGVVMKPYQSDQLFAKIREALDN